MATLTIGYGQLCWCENTHLLLRHTITHIGLTLFSWSLSVFYK